ncbi:MAG: carboxypeptidase regulatory-like domain-containing protein [Acidobacteria bacterium]|nr:carboxypeptidase regulatory-like domain-containing protein [Acidobacteriota bacterium]
MPSGKQQLQLLQSFLALLFVLTMVGQAMSQTVTGTVSGSVMDSTNNAIVGATVTLVNERTKDSRAIATNDSGDFRFTAVLPGTYTIKVEARGFSNFERRGNVLTATEHLSVGEVSMKIGAVTETVTTVAEGTPVQTESVEHSALVTSKQLELISQRGRDVTSLLKILPGVSYGGESESAGSSFGSGVPNIQGGRNTFNTFNVDGVRGNDLGSPNVFSSTVNFDAISEVKVLLNGYQAEYASNSSANVNIITKSGSSQYHGSGYWYKRHEQFNANNFFNNNTLVTSPLTGKTTTVPKPRYRYNTLGATFGGPVWLPKVGDKVKDKLFFFYSFEDSQTLNPQALRQVTTATDLERKGDFSKSFTSLDSSGKPVPLFIRDPTKTGNCNATDQTACFPGNVIPANRINKNGQALLSVFPLPNATNLSITKAGYNYLFQESIKVPKRQNLFRTDYRPSARDSFYVRGSMWYADNQGIAVPAGTANWGLAGLHYTFTDNSIIGNWTRVLSTRLVNEASLGVRHSVEKGPPLNDAELAKLQKATYGYTLGQFHPELNPLGIIPQVSFGNITSPANITYDGRTPLRGADTIITFTDNLSYTLGSHNLKAGFYAERARNYEGATAVFGGQFTFSNDANNPLNSGYAYANAILGNFTQYTEATFRPSGEGRQSLVDWFVQDSWKATRRLNIEYGVRFGWFNQWYQDTANSAAFALSRYDKSKAPKYYQPGCTVAVPAGGTCAAANRRALNPVNGQLLPAVLIGAFVPGTGDPYNGMVLGTDSSYPRGFKEQQPVQVQPRLGFAWDVKGDGKLAVRGSFGVFNQTRVSANAIWTDVARNPPIADNPRIFYGNMDSLLSSGGTLFPSSVTGFDLDAPTPVTYSYNLGIQKDLGFGTVLDVSYVGSQSRHLQQQRNINLIPYRARHLDVNPQNANPTVANTALPDDFLRPYPGYGNITYYDNAGYSNYNALQVAANRRFARGLQFGLAYTYSKTMDLVDGDRDGGLATYRPYSIWNYGRAGFDQTHVMVINYTWDIPRASKLWDNRAVKAVFDDWQLSGITAFASGTPGGIGLALVDSGTDLSGGGDGTRVNVIGNPNLSDSKQTVASTGFVQWINPAAFARPARGDFGNAPKDVFRNPGTHNWDFSLFKNIPLKSESRYLQFRWEMYNAFNHTQWSGIDTTARFDTSGNQVNARFGQVNAARSARVMQGSLRITF